MNEALFPAAIIPEHLLKLEYRGPSFEGMMEIGLLKTEIEGLEEAIEIATRVLSRHKKIDFTTSDIEIFIEAFEHGSFRKNVKLLVKGLNNNQGVIALAALLISLFQLIPNYSTEQLKEMSASTIARIGDQVKIELLKDRNFTQAVANMVRPLSQKGDEFVCVAPENGEVTVTYSEKQDFLNLAEEQPQEVEDGDHFEILEGYINKVDLDATKRHLGFKTNGEGNSISATISDSLRQSVDMRLLLGQWVQIDAITTYRGGLRDHISIDALKVIKQQSLGLDAASNK